MLGAQRQLFIVVPSCVGNNSWQQILQQTVLFESPGSWLSEAVLLGRSIDWIHRYAGFKASSLPCWTSCGLVQGQVALMLLSVQRSQHVPEDDDSKGETEKDESDIDVSSDEGDNTDEAKEGGKSDVEEDWGLWD